MTRRVLAVLLLCAFSSLPAQAQITPAPQGHIIRDEGTQLPQQPYLNFTGPGVACTTDAANRATTCTIAGAAIPASFAVGDLLYADTTTTLAKLAAVATGSLLASGGVTTAPAWSASPTLTTSLTTPLLIGGTTTTSPLTYKTTTGVGTTGADHIFKVGNNGATEALRILNSGLVGIGQAAPLYTLEVVSSAAQIRFGTTTSDDGGWLYATTGNTSGLTGGAAHNGTNWIAKNATASIIFQTGGVFQWYANTGLTPGNSFSPTIQATITATGAVTSKGTMTPISATAITGGGVLAITLGSSAPGIYVGSGAPSASAVKGSLYIRSDGTGVNDRAYINTNGSTTWTPLVTVG